VSLHRVDRKNIKRTECLPISVIIAAKNEEKNIKKLIDSLFSLNYPKDNFEVIIVDDNSTDNTLSELKRYTENNNHCKSVELKPTGLKGKRDALSFGIQHSKHPCVLITDADCQPQSNWLNEYSNRFQSGYDMLLGIAPFYQNKSIVNQISCFENLRSSLLGFSLAILGMPYTTSARNFGFSKNAFDKIGGYSKTKDTLSGDDDLLLREAIKNNLKIGVVTEPGSYVFSESKKTFSEYFRQKARHTQTSFHYLLNHKLVLGVWHLLNLSLLFSPVLMFINPMFGILLPSKLLIDSILVKSTQKKFSYNFSVMQIVYLQIIYEFFLIVHFFNSKFSRIKWK
jgi:cellulose synthase/poly-beta-1,6-N-acetylglucosamine synthase-like glycosyltransferase